MKPDYTLLTTNPPAHQLKSTPSQSNRKVAVVGKSDMVSQKVVKREPVAKKDKIEVVGMSKDKLPAARYKSASQAAVQVKKEERKIDLKITDSIVAATPADKESKKDSFNTEISVSFTDSLASGKKTPPTKKDAVQIAKPSGSGDATQKARDMATSVVSEQTKNATGVVSDTSDLDVWKAEKSAAKSDAAPKTVAIEKTSDNMVSLVGLKASASAGAAESQAPVAANTDTTPAAGDDEKIQMVIQHPDGSYQVIEGEEAARLMQQAADGGATFMEEGATTDKAGLKHYVSVAWYIFCNEAFVFALFMTVKLKSFHFLTVVKVCVT